MGALRIKLVVMPAPAYQNVPTLWQLTKICPLKAEVLRGEFQPSPDDVVFAGHFRLAPCLVENPFNIHTNYNLANFYPADWYLPFWSIYHKVAGAGLFFVLDDHETDPHNGPHMRGSEPLGFAPASLSATVTFGPDTIHLLFCQHPPTDYTVPGRAAPLPTYVQSGTLAVMGIDGITDWYDIALLYRRFVWDMPVAQRRRQGGIRAPYRDIALAIGPVPHWRHFFAGAGPFTAEFVTGLSSFLAAVPSGIPPTLYFHAYTWALDDPNSPACGTNKPLPVPACWGGFRLPVASLIQQVHSSGGVAMGYINGLTIDRTWAEANQSWALLANEGHRVLDPSTFYYCHATPEMKRIWNDFLLTRTLQRNPDMIYLDALHVDGIDEGTRCSDGGADPAHLHGHRLQTSEEHEAYDLLLGYARDGSPDRFRFFDQEIPLEGLIHRVDSNAQPPPNVYPPSPRNPRLHRMVYKNLTRYTFPAIIWGTHRAAGFYPIYDLHELHVLTEGGIPVVFTYDTPGSILTDLESNRATIGLIKAYLLNYQSILKPVYDGDLIPFPMLDPGGFGRPPQCGIHIVGGYVVKTGSNAMRWIHPDYRLVHGSAYWRDGSVSLVMLDWAHDCLGTDLCPPFNSGAFPGFDQYRWVDFPSACEIRTFVYRDIPSTNVAPFESNQTVHLDLVASLLRLDPRVRYRLSLVVLDPLGGTPREVAIHEVIGEELGQQITSMIGAQRVGFRLPAASLSVLAIL